jgi:hypothetical protein
MSVTLTWRPLSVHATSLNGQFELGNALKRVFGAFPTGPVERGFKSRPLVVFRLGVMLRLVELTGSRGGALFGHPLAPL